MTSDLGGAALDLTEQPLPTRQITESDMPVASSNTNFGLPRRTSSMPSTSTGRGCSGRTAAACAAATTGQPQTPELQFQTARVIASTAMT
ncbi:hypothetical protein ABT346_20085 [Micromonospora peucetia]